MNKKILTIINNLGVGGAERLVVGDVNEMLRTGVNAMLITLKPEPQKSFAAELHLAEDEFYCIPFRRFFDVYSWFKLVRVIRAFKPDLVITQLWFANTIGRIAGRIAGAKNIISFEQNVYDAVKTRKMFFVDWCLQFLSTKIVAVSETVKKSLARHHIRELKIDVLHNSIELSRFRDFHGRTRVREEFNIPERAFLFLFIGRLIHQKAVDVLIEAFKGIETESYLLIVGQGNERDALEERVKRNGLEERVIFAGVRSDIPSLLLSSDCFILPSRYEGLPVVLIEALTAGKAIIVSDFESAGEIIIHEKNGLIFPREDVRALAQAMLRVRDDETLRSTLSVEAKKTSERFSISNHVQAILRYVKT